MSSIKNEIKIIKSGIFYNVYGEDVYIFNLLLNYKINIAPKTGFPEKSLTKVDNTPEDAKISD